MSHFIVVYAKYFLTLFLYLFLACGLLSLRYESVSDQKAAANLQNVFLFLTKFGALFF